MSDSNTIEFSFSEMGALASLIRELNVQGVPYALQKDGYSIAVSIQRGY